MQGAWEGGAKGGDGDVLVSNMIYHLLVLQVQFGISIGVELHTFVTVFALGEQPEYIFANFSSREWSHYLRCSGRGDNARPVRKNVRMSLPYLNCCCDTVSATLSAASMGFEGTCFMFRYKIEEPLVTR